MTSLRDLFDLIDEDGSGEISPEELGKILSDLGEVFTSSFFLDFILFCFDFVSQTISTRRRLKRS